MDTIHFNSVQAIGTDFLYQYHEGERNAIASRHDQCACFDIVTSPASRASLLDMSQIAGHIRHNVVPQPKLQAQQSTRQKQENLGRIALGAKGS